MPVKAAFERNWDRKRAEPANDTAGTILAGIILLLAAWKAVELIVALVF